jgi:ComF family protein
VGALRVSGYFDGPLRQAVHRLKFSGERYLAEPLGEILAATWNHGPLPADALVTVPLHPKHEAARGYNQSLLLARAAGARLGLPVIDDGLRRVRETPPQMGLPREERLANVRGAFAWQSDRPCPARLVLVDDVMTTGATLAACAAALRQAGASHINALVLARAK